MATMDQRVSRFEGAFEHLATKEDLARLESKLTWRLLIGLFLQAGLVITVMTIIICQITNN